MSDTKERKPWYRPRNVFFAVLVAVVLFFGWAFLEVWQVYTAEPSPTIDYRAKLREMAEQNAGVSPEEADESWAILIRALDRYKDAENEINAELAETGFSSRHEFDRGEVDFGYPLFGPTLPKDVDREQRCLQRIRDLGVMDLITELSTRGMGIRRPDGIGPMINDLLPSAAAARDFARSQAVAIRIAVAEGDFQQVVASLDRTITLVNVISHQPSLIEHLVSISMMALVVNQLKYALLERGFEIGAYSLLSETLRKYSPSPFTFALKCERVSYHELADWAFTDEGNGDGFITSRLDTWTLNANRQYSFGDAIVARFYCATKKETKEEIDLLINWLIAEAEAEPTQVGLRDRFERRIHELSMTGRFPFIRDLFGAPDRAIRIEDALQVEVSATLVMIAIAQYKLRQGKYPAHLDDLVPEILAEVPIDPLHGGAFGYRLTPDDPHGRPYLLYSTGLDRNDDGGDFDVADSLRCIDDPNAQTDYTVNQPRRPMAEYWDERR